MKKFCIILLCALMVVGLTGCGSSSKEPEKDWREDYTVYELDHMKVYVPKEIVLGDFEAEGWDFAKSGDEIAVLGALDTYDELSQFGVTFDTLKDYAELVTQNNNGELVDKGTYYEYTYHYDQTSFYYCVGIYKTSAGFWNLNFAFQEANYTKYEASMKDWLSKVEFD